MTTRKGSGDKSGGSAPDLNRSQIDDNLKRVYDDMLDDDVPDRFEELLRKLRQQDQQR